MNILKTRVKELVSEVLMRTGVWKHSLRRWARRGEAIILVYHRVLEKWDRTLDYSQPGMVVTADTFDRQLTFLKKHFNIVSLSDLVSSPSTLNSQVSTICPSCALTFDDGWRDNYEVALPILQKHKVPATIFLTTDFIGTNRSFWHTRLMYVLLHGDISNGMQIGRVLQGYPEVIGQSLMGLVSMTEAPSAQGVDPIVEVVKGTCDEETIEELVGELAYACGFCRPLLADRRFFLDWNQVCEMASKEIEIGSHGCSHRILTRVQPIEAEDELITSKAEIEQRIDGKIRHFAFPDGAVNRSIIESAGRAGYESVSVLARAPEARNTDIVTRRRVGMHEGVSRGSDGFFSEASLMTWLLRAPRTRSGLP